MAAVQVRYIVNDVDAAIAFYCQHLGFSEVMHLSPMFVMLSRGDLRTVPADATRSPTRLILPARMCRFGRVLFV